MSSNYGYGWDSATYDAWRTREPDDYEPDDVTQNLEMGFFYGNQFFVVKGEWSVTCEEWRDATVEEWDEEANVIPEEYADIPPNIYADVIDKVMAEKSYEWIEEVDQ